MAVVLIFGLVVASVPVGRATRIADTSPDATAWNSQRKIARDSQGGLYIALRVPDPTLGIAVRIFRSSDGGSTWSLLPRVPDATLEMARAALAIDPKDGLHLAWTELVGIDLQVFHAIWTGTGWTPRVQVSATPGYSGFPSMAVDHQDRLHVAWYGFDGTTYQVYYRVRAASGAWGATETVSTGLQDANNPALALGPDDRPHVAWFLVSGPRWSVVYTSREARWNPVVALSDSANRALDPSLAVTSQGHIFATWTELSPNGTRAPVARFRNASGWSDPTALAWFTAPGGHPTVALDGNDRAFVFWDQLDSTIRYRTYNGTWGLTAALAANGNASFPSVRWAAVANPLFPGANRLDVAWTEEINRVYSVAIGGIPVPPVGEPPTASTNWTAGFVLASGVLVVGGILWLRHLRMRRRLGPPGPGS